MSHIRIPSNRYKSAKAENWVGRSVDSKDGIQYWYQAVESIDIQKIINLNPNNSESKIAIIGFACDEGVKRNQGREGAKEGPSAIKRQIAKLAFHHSKKGFFDFGDIVCQKKEMEQSQSDLAQVISHSLRQDFFPIVLGGGHEVAYGTFSGIWDVLSNSDRKVGIINFDAHFDLRPVTQAAHSGTPFNQIMTEYGDRVFYSVYGIQQVSNTRSLFDVASGFGVNYVPAVNCVLANIENIYTHLNHLIKEVDDIYITIDMDGFTSSFAPGVSAPSPMGFEPNFVTTALKHIFKSRKVVACDIAETNPSFDKDNMTAKLAARLVDCIAGLI